MNECCKTLRSDIPGFTPLRPNNYQNTTTSVGSLPLVWGQHIFLIDLLQWSSPLTLPLYSHWSLNNKQKKQPQIMLQSHAMTSSIVQKGGWESTSFVGYLKAPGCMHVHVAPGPQLNLSEENPPFFCLHLAKLSSRSLWSPSVSRLKALSLGIKKRLETGTTSCCDVSRSCCGRQPWTRDPAV